MIVVRMCHEDDEHDRVAHWTRGSSLVKEAASAPVSSLSLPRRKWFSWTWYANRLELRTLGKLRILDFQYMSSSFKCSHDRSSARAGRGECSDDDEDRDQEDDGKQGRGVGNSSRLAGTFFFSTSDPPRWQDRRITRNLPRRQAIPRAVL